MTQNPENYQPQESQPQYTQGQQQYPAQYQNYYPTVAEPKGLSMASMVLGICSVLFGVIFFVPIVGLILGILGLRREPAGRGMAIAGIILNGMFLVLWALLLILGISFLSLLPVIVDA